MKLKRIKFGRMAELVKDGYSPSLKEPLNYIGLEHIEQQSLRLIGVGSSMEVGSNKFRFRKDDILFGKLRPYFRKVYKPNFSGVCSTDIWVIRAKEGFDQGFLFYFIANEDFVNQSDSGSTGTRMPRADWEHLSNTEWLVPIEKIDQLRIGAMFSVLDNKIELNLRINQTLEQIAQTIFQHWFIEQSQKKEIVDIEKYVEFDPKISIKRGEVLPFVDMKSLSTSGMAIANVVNKPFTGGSKFQNNDTLLARITPCLENGKTGFIRFLDNDSSVALGSTEFIVMRARKGISPQFVYCLARSDAFRAYAIKSMVGSSGRQRVQLDMLRQYQIKKVGQEMMDRFHHFTQPLFSMVNSRNQEIESLGKIRDLLLPKLMSGEIRIN